MDRCSLPNSSLLIISSYPHVTRAIEQVRPGENRALASRARRVDAQTSSRRTRGPRRESSVVALDAENRPRDGEPSMRSRQQQVRAPTTIDPASLSIYTCIKSEMKKKNRPVDSPILRYFIREDPYLLYREPAICRTRAAADDDALRHPLDHRDVAQGPSSGRLSPTTGRRRRGSAAEYPRARLVSPRPSVSSLSSSAAIPRGAIRVRIPRVYMCVSVTGNERARARARVDLRALWIPGAVSVAHARLLKLYERNLLKVGTSFQIRKDLLSDFFPHDFL